MSATLMVARNLGLNPRGLQQRLQGHLSKEAEADPAEYGDSGGWGAGGQGAEDNGEEVRFVGSLGTRVN